ncbi:uncharacterized protein il12rb1 isoform X2 [Alosa pseudoharengus]|uniref:uncharacterized protein il12rb1 isoform X2 n=1 Tax=Alosa pseudoharengus TaxID=34774 RepID=UPI003F8C6326
MGVCVPLCGLLCVLVSASPARGDSTCTAPSSPVCYKSSRRPDVDFKCEWTSAEDMRGFSYTLHLRNETENIFENISVGEKQSCTLTYERVTTYIPLQIWVSAHRNHSSCSSAHTYIQLDQSVKYPAPAVKHKSRSSGLLILKMDKPADFKAADYQIRYKETRDNTSPWAYKNFTTEEHKNITDVFQMSVRMEAAYELHVRRRARQVRYAAWSDETYIIIPVRLTAALAVSWNTTLNQEKNARTLTLSWEHPSSELSAGGLRFNVSYSVWPCGSKAHSTEVTEVTEVKLNITLSEVQFSIYARNQMDCPRTLVLEGRKRERKQLCWEWYRLDDGETRPDPTHVHSVTKTTASSITQIADMKDSVRYYYFIHTRKKNPHTLYSCPVYTTESTPQVSPLNLTVPVVTPTSLKVCWLPIPVAQQQGFLTHYHLCLSGDCENVSESQTCNTFRNLKPGSKYSISVAAATRMGSGPAVMENIWTSEDGTEMTGSQRDVIIIIVSLLVLTLLALCPFLFIRLVSHKLPAVPKPVIAVSIKYSPSSQEVPPPKEEVHVVTLEHVQKPPETLCITPEEEHTLLQEEEEEEHTLLQEEEEEEEEHTLLQEEEELGRAESGNTHQEGEEGEEEGNEEDQVMKTDECDGTLNPNYKRQTLRIPEVTEMMEKALSENECDVTLPVYKNVQVFDMKPEVCENGESFV